MTEMRRWLKPAAVASAVALTAGRCAAGPVPSVAHGSIDVSLRLEVRSSTLRASRFLLSRQLPDGSWSRHPLITTYALLALVNGPEASAPACGRAVAEALAFIAAQVHADGSVWNERCQEYRVHSTAISLRALARMDRPEHRSAIRIARRFLIGTQRVDVPDSDPRFGGFAAAVGGTPDLTTTQWVLEALYLADRLAHNWTEAAASHRRGMQEVYKRALVFISRCQRLEAAARAPEPLSLGEPPGWFEDHPEGVSARVAVSATPRGIGFLTYAGLTGLLFAGASPEDIRVRSAIAWAVHHYTTDENPGLGSIGLYTYLYSMTRALKAWELRSGLMTAPPTPAWRAAVASRLLSLQRGTGEWAQDVPAWWETQPELMTAYGLLTLQLVCGPGE